MLTLTVIGNLGRDAQLNSTQNGTQVCNIAIGASYGMKDQNTGNKPTQWVEASLWGKQAEALAPYLTKGKKVVVTIKDAHIEHFAKQDGTQGTKLTGHVTDIEFAGSNQQQEGQQQAQQPQTHYQQQPAQAPIQQPVQQPQNQMGDFNDDIPF